MKTSVLPLLGPSLCRPNKGMEIHNSASMPSLSSGGWFVEDDPLTAGWKDHSNAAVPADKAVATETQTHLCLPFLLCLSLLALSTRSGANVSHFL